MASTMNERDVLKRSILLSCNLAQHHVIHLHSTDDDTTRISRHIVLVIKCYASRPGGVTTPLSNITRFPFQSNHFFFCHLPSCSRCFCSSEKSRSDVNHRISTILSQTNVPARPRHTFLSTKSPWYETWRSHAHQCRRKSTPAPYSAICSGVLFHVDRY